MAATMKIEGLTQFNQMLEGLKRESDQSERLMKLISQRIRSMQKKHFDKQEDSTGDKWQPLAASTIKGRSGRVEKGILRKYKSAASKYGVKLSTEQLGIALKGELSQRGLLVASRYPILRDTNRMFTAITAFNTDKMAGAGIAGSSDFKYPRIHQFGGKAGRGLKVTIPKREYLYINDAEKEVLTAMVIKQMIQSQLGGQTN